MQHPDGLLREIYELELRLHALRAMLTRLHAMPPKTADAKRSEPVTGPRQDRPGEWLRAYV